MLQAAFFIITCFVVILAYADTEYKTEKVCEIKTTKSGDKEYCRRVLVQEKSEKHKKTDKK